MLTRPGLMMGLCFTAIMGCFGMGKGTGGPLTSEQTLSLPGKPWSLGVDLTGFTLDQRGRRPNGSGESIQASDPITGLIVSVFLEAQPSLHSTKECKRFYWEKAAQTPLPKSDIQHLTSGSMETVHWVVKEFRGVPVMQKNVNAYLYNDGACVDVHLSKVQYVPTDEALFDEVLESVRFSGE